MQTIKVKQKKTEKKDIGGMIIGLIFLAVLIAVGWFVADNLIIGREVTVENIAKVWHIPKDVGGKDIEYWEFIDQPGENVNGVYEGIAKTYKKNADTNVNGESTRYTFTIHPPSEGKTHPELWLVPEPGSYKDKNERDQKSLKIRVSRVTRAEMTVELVYDRFTTKTTRMVTDLF